MEEQLKAVCVNPWCKATFYYKEEDMIVKTKNNGFAKVEIKEPPKYCYKCISFDKELSGGVTWIDKEYEGSRFDSLPHEIKYKVTNYKQ